MTNQLDELERILGGKIEQRGQRAIPGATLMDGKEFLYYQDDGKNKPKKQFNLLFAAAGSITATSGGVVSGGCCISLPTGTLFHALSYHGDIPGWRSAVEAGAKARGLLLARVDGGLFVVSDGRSFSLSDCNIKFI